MKEYIERTYRKNMKSSDLVYFRVSVQESDLYIGALKDISEKAITSLKKHRQSIINYISKNSLFKSSLSPVPVINDMCPLIKDMTEAASVAGVGPMASVAGAIAEYVARDLLPFSEELIIENGGDLFITGKKDRKVGIFAGSSPLSGKIAIDVPGTSLPVAVATSSGTVGPSLSFGKADAVVVLSPSGSMADAAATAIGNIVTAPEDFQRATEFAESISSITGVIIICKDKICLRGDIKISPCKTF
ncbi:MAG: UPF0280 family protein [Candidatus Eremiobacterota bacterium]